MAFVKIRGKAYGPSSLSFERPGSTAFANRKDVPIIQRLFKGLLERKEDLASGFRDFHTRSHHYQTSFARFVKEGKIGRWLLRTFRTSSAFSVVFSSALLVSATNFSQGKENDGTLLGYFSGSGETEVSVAGKRLAATMPRTDNLSLVPLASASSSVDTNAKDDINTVFDIAPGNLSLESQLVLSDYQGSPNIARDPEEEDGVRIYTVESGDTVSGIAAKFGITTNTILWANDIQNVDSIKPGDQIFILPVAGLTHVAKAGETIDDIAKSYKADREKIIAFNDLPANGEIKVGESIVIPGGIKEVPEASSVASGLGRRQYATSAGGGAADLSVSGWRKLEGKAGTGHKFPYGYCTWYVAQRRYVPWRGNAGTWLYNAKSMGYKTGKTPTPGSIVVTTENVYYGHVALVEKVENGQIYLSEMNYRGWAKTSKRWLSTSSRVIKGYIY